MNDYTGKVCPYCKSAFKPDDEIVVCSECDMPHHKDCWIENQGCTTFGCLGTIKSVDGTNSSVTTTEMGFEDVQKTTAAVIYCTRCGSQNASTNTFCSGCGNRLTLPTATHAPTFQQSDPSNTNPYAYAELRGAVNYNKNNNTSYTYNESGTDSLTQRFVGTNSDYYMSKFREMKAQNKKNTWNWSAFLFAPFWLIYRKMYAYGAALFGISFVLSLFGAVPGSVLSLCCYVAFGLFGNYMYMSFLEKKENQAKTMTDPYKTQFVEKNSGVNSTATVLSVVGCVLLIIILSL